MAANVIKTFLRELLVPIFPFEKYDEVMDIEALAEGEKVTKTIALLKSIPVSPI